MKRDLTRFHSPTTENKDSVPVQLEALSASNTFAEGDSGNNASEIKRGHHQITQKMGRSISGNKEKPDLDLAESPPNNPQHQITQKTSKITESITEKSNSNNTGLPDDLKSGIENLSGYLMDDVKVHRNSDKPAQLQAHAYAQGTDIHLGSGQEKHLPHEAWHVVQQKQGRVKPTMQMKGGVNVNDDKGLEKEADVMGGKTFMFVDNRPEAVAQRGVQEMENHTVLLHQTIQKKADYLDSIAFNVTQLNRWGEWEDSLSKVTPSTAELATFGMSIVNMFRDRGIQARIGGSLAAKMYGGTRDPLDLDIEIPGRLENSAEAKGIFQRLIGRPEIAWIQGKSIFFITDFSKASGVINITYKSGVTERELDPLEDDEEIESAFDGLAEAPAFQTSVDFSSESLFASKDLEPTSTQNDDRGHYGWDYLVASYLNRLASNLEEQVPDPKDDRGQVKAILTQLIESKGISKLDIKEFIENCKKIIMGYVKNSNDKSERIIKIYESIGTEVEESFSK
ncbi:DUF4157 domain-containing protein [Marivirga lumbricoides]